MVILKGWVQLSGLFNSMHVAHLWINVPGIIIFVQLIIQSALHVHVNWVSRISIINFIILFIALLFVGFHVL